MIMFTHTYMQCTALYLTVAYSYCIFCFFICDVLFYRIVYIYISYYDMTMFFFIQKSIVHCYIYVLYVVVLYRFYFNCVFSYVYIYTYTIFTFLILCIQCIVCMFSMCFFCVFQFIYIYVIYSLDIFEYTLYIYRQIDVFFNLLIYIIFDFMF